jgi:hypothetical protein
VQENQVEAAVSCFYNKICIKGEPKRQETIKKTLPSSPIVATAIPSRLALATINSLDDLPYCAHSILQQFFFPSRFVTIDFYIIGLKIVSFHFFLHQLSPH